MDTAADQKLALSLLRRSLPRDADLQVLDDFDEQSVARIHYGDLAPIRVLLTERREPQDQQTDPLRIQILRSGNAEEQKSLQKAGASYVDLEGAICIQAPGFYLERSDLSVPAVSTGTNSGIDPYADRASRVCRVLLMAPRNRRWSTRGLAEAADVHPSTVSRAIRELERRELVQDDRPGERRRSRIWLPDGEALISDWARTYRWQDNRQLRLAAPVGSPNRFIERMSDTMEGSQWALTLHAGASLLAPQTQFEVVHAFVESDTSLEELAMRQEWEVSSSGKLCLLEPVDVESVWFQLQTIDGIPVVGPVQLVLDLWSYPVRGREQAQHLIETVLRPIWNGDDESAGA